MLALRLGFTIAVMAVAVWLALAGHPFGGLVLVPLAAIWLRRAVETRRLKPF
jgi:hypothetical protein